MVFTLNLPTLVLGGVILAVIGYVWGSLNEEHRQRRLRELYEDRQRAFRAFDHDGDGRPGGSKKKSK